MLEGHLSWLPSGIHTTSSIPPFTKEFRWVSTQGSDTLTTVRGSRVLQAWPKALLPQLKRNKCVYCRIQPHCFRLPPQEEPTGAAGSIRKDPLTFQGNLELAPKLPGSASLCPEQDPTSSQTLGFPKQVSLGATQEVAAPRGVPTSVPPVADAMGATGQEKQLCIPTHRAHVTAREQRAAAGPRGATWCNGAGAGSLTQHPTHCYYCEIPPADWSTSRSPSQARDAPQIPALCLKLRGHRLQKAEPKLRCHQCHKPSVATLRARDKASMVCFSIQKPITTSPSLLHSSFVLTYT